MKYKNFIISLLLSVLVVGGCVQKRAETKKIQVGVFNGNGASPICVIETMEALKIDSGINAQVITAAEIQDGKISSFDVVIFPGGSGSTELNNIGQRGTKLIADFVKEKGKGVVGICAGAYLLSSTKDYPSLQLSSSEHIDRPHYNRGRGLVEVKLAADGNHIFPELADRSFFIQYYDGPVLQQIDSIEEKYVELAQYVTDIHPDDYAPTGITPGKTFLFKQQVGKGRIMSMAGHAESTPGIRWIVPRMARWAAGSKLVSYDEKWIRPEINDSAIFFDKANKRLEKKLFWQLFDDDPQIRIQAMDKLYELRSRPAVRWYIGLLRDDDAGVRKNAAKLIKLCEYTAALPDLIQSYRNETNSETKAIISEAIVFLGGESLLTNK